MNIRNYNKYFHLHTISGIIITVLLYIIFFAGSFAFFRNEIGNWQSNQPQQKVDIASINYNVLLDSLDTQFGLQSRNISFRMNDRSRVIGYNISSAQDTLVPKAKERSFGLYDPITKEKNSYEDAYSLGEFLYRLHFLAQLNGLVNIHISPFGYFVAGLVSFIYLFALITGLLVHWQKIVSNFYVFRPWEKLKTVWTDLHTALGVITFPFQLIFAITGAYFLLNYRIVAATIIALGYGGDADKFNKDAYENRGAQEIVYQNKPIEHDLNLNYYIEETVKRWDDPYISNISIKNYGDESMTVEFLGRAHNEKQLNSRGEIKYHVFSGEVEEISNPNVNPGYTYVFSNLVYLLHFGSFGGYATRIVYFLVGIAGCIVIISGVLIWLVARDKKNVPEHKRKFNFWLANIYMAICLSMYPVTALAFIAVKINPTGGQSFVYSFYFWTWLAITILLCIRKSIYKTNRDCLLIGSIIGLFIPIANGIMTGNWIWVSWSKGYHDILLIDLFWIIVPIITLYSWKLIRNKHEKKSQEEIAITE
ncbi:PepSY domain-containing protein [Myroides odoratimimus]|uniref:PepSY-associated TM helix domain-containing protein n=1 Tax=Myroides odoratimimus TaxID=76832 RepID=UPI0025760C8A|nr:PepSY-associated TM helix domain-containing protein [Myroides odoratimimus]MDM1396818.1 PepSY domain-containing protein [Myroides odoratimimus]